MAWSFQEIEQDWLQGSRLALEPKIVVEAFNQVDELLGSEWIKASRISQQGNITRGASPTLRVVTMGERLRSLEGVQGADRLITELLKDRRYASSELTAIHLLRAYRPKIEIELYSTVTVGSRQRVVDFSVRQHNGHWTYVEVTQPGFSEAHRRLNAVLQDITELVSEVKVSFSLEVFLRREPTDAELDLVTLRVQDICQRNGTHRDELPDGLGFLLLGASKPGKVDFQTHPGEESRPRLSAVKRIVGPDEPDRQMLVRIAFADERAETVLRKEARQLPKNAPGLVMAEMSGAPGGIKSWEPLVMRRFQRNLNTRVSGVCLFSSGLNGTENGEAWLPETRILLNPYAKYALPTYLVEVLDNSRAEFETALGVSIGSA